MGISTDLTSGLTNREWEMVACLEDRKGQEEVQVTGQQTPTSAAELPRAALSVTSEDVTDKQVQ